MNVSINAVTNSAKLREAERERKNKLNENFLKKGITSSRMRLTTCKNTSLSAK